MGINESLKYGVSDEHWASLTDLDRELYRKIRPLRRAAYSVNNRILHIERSLRELDEDARAQGGQLELNPDFQRGHVWTQEKQVAFIESAIRGVAPMVIRFNCPSWVHSAADVVEGLNPHSVLCVDGLQRLTAMRDFVAGKFKVFGEYSVEDLDDTTFSLRRLGMNWTMEMFDIPTRADLLQFYLDLNSGGVVHSPEELARVGGLLEQARQPSPPSSPKAPKP